MGWLYILSAMGVGGILLFSASCFASLRYLKISQCHELNSFLYGTLVFFSLFYFLRQNEISFLIIGFTLASYAQVRWVGIKPYHIEK